MKEFIEKIHYYLEEGKIVFTARFHIQRGSCCGSKCRHCAYEPQHIKNNTNLQEQYLEKPKK
jgi:hypothetical protein